MDSNTQSTVQRAVELLRCFSLEQPELSVTELSQKLDVHKSTVSRLLATLAAERLVERNPENGKYHLGIGLLELAGRVTLHADLRAVARPHLRQLSEATREMVNLAVLESGESVNLEQAVPYDRHISGIGWIGRRVPLHASSTGKVLLAFQSDPEILNLLPKPLTRFTANTLCNPDLIYEEVYRIREQGYATGFEELEIGLNAVAAPVFDHTGQVIAAVSVTGPSPRLSRERICEQVVDQVLETAGAISEAFGWTGAT